MSSWMVKLFMQLAKASMKDPQTRRLGADLAAVLSNHRTVGKAPAIAARITNINPKIKIFSSPTPNRFTDKKIFWDQLSGMSGEQIKQPTKNVVLRKGVYFNKGYKTASPSYWAGFKKTPMVDIDFDAPLSHAAHQVVFHGPRKQARERAIKNIINYTKNNKKAKFRLYDTNAGLRVFDLSRRSKVSNKTLRRDVDLGGDRLYREGTERDKIFYSRLMPKPGRPGDVVAERIGDIGTGVANPKNLQEIQKYHDDLIKILLQISKEQGHTNLGGLFSRLPLTGFPGRVKIS